MSAPAWPAPVAGTRWLLRLPNWIGDAVMVLPALRALPRADQFWMAVAHPRVSPLYEATNLFEHMLPARGASAPLQLRARLRAFAPDRAVVFTQAVSGGLLARFSGASLRVGRAGSGRGALFTHALSPEDRALPLWEQYLEVARHAGGSPRADGVGDFRIDAGEAAHRGATKLLAGYPDTALVAVAPGAAYGPAKQWPLEHFESLTRQLVEAGRGVVVVGGAAERPAGLRLAAAGALDLTGRTGLLEAIAVLGRCAGAVTNDSGALHLARAAGTPVVGLFGSSSPHWTGPTGPEGEALHLGLECSPCYRRRCPLEGEDHMRCLADITVERTLETLGRIAAP